MSGILTILSSILGPLVIVTIVLPSLTPAGARFRDLPGIMLVWGTGNREQRRRLRTIMASRSDGADFYPDTEDSEDSEETG